MYISLSVYLFIYLSIYIWTYVCVWACAYVRVLLKHAHTVQPAGDPPKEVKAEAKLRHTAIRSGVTPSQDARIDRAWSQAGNKALETLEEGEPVDPLLVQKAKELVVAGLDRKQRMLQANRESQLALEDSKDEGPLSRGSFKASSALEAAAELMNHHLPTGSLKRSTSALEESPWLDTAQLRAAGAAAFTQEQQHKAAVETAKSLSDSQRLKRLKSEEALKALTLAQEQYAAALRDEDTLPLEEQERLLAEQRLQKEQEETRLREQQRLQKEQEETRLLEQQRLQKKQEETRLLEQQRLQKEQEETRLLEQQRLQKEQEESRLREQQRLQKEQEESRLREQQRLQKEQEETRLREQQRLQKEQEESRLRGAELKRRLSLQVEEENLRAREAAAETAKLERKRSYQAMMDEAAKQQAFAARMLAREEEDEDPLALTRAEEDKIHILASESMAKASSDIITQCLARNCSHEHIQEKLVLYYHEVAEELKRECLQNRTPQHFVQSPSTFKQDRIHAL